MKYFSPFRGKEFVPLFRSDQYDKETKLIEESEYLHSIYRKGISFAYDEFEEINDKQKTHKPISKIKTLDNILSVISEKHLEDGFRYEFFPDRSKDTLIPSKYEAFALKLKTNLKNISEEQKLIAIRKRHDVLDLLKDLEIISFYRDNPKEGKADNEKQAQMQEDIRDIHRCIMINEFKSYEKSNSLTLTNILNSILKYLFNVRRKYEDHKNNH